MEIFLSILIISIIVFGLGYIFDRWVTPWRTERILNKIVFNIKSSKLEEEKNYKFEIAIDSAGLKKYFLIKPLQEPLFFYWINVVRVMAFKRDHYTVDCICMVFELDNNTFIEVDEEMKGWDELTSSLPNHLPGCKQWHDWFSDVAFPAFETNATELFLRQNVAYPIL